MKYFVPVASGLKAVFEVGSFVESLDLVNQFGEVILESELSPTIGLKENFVTIEIVPDSGQQVGDLHWGLANALESVYLAR